jgi:undecaprenyl-diphosphatase
MVEKILNLDRDLFIFLNGLGSERYDWFWLIVTKQASWIPIFAILLYLLYKRFGWKHSLLIMVSVAVLLTLTDQTTNLVKDHFHRLRPGNNPKLEHLMRIVQRRNSFSFFSGHAANSMSAAVFLYLVMKPYLKYMGFIFLWPLIFAYSRIYLGLHYPLDIMCGYVWGTITGILVFQGYRFARNKIFPAQKENLDHPTNA